MGRKLGHYSMSLLRKAAKNKQANVYYSECSKYYVLSVRGCHKLFEKAKDVVNFIGRLK